MNKFIEIMQKVLMPFAAKVTKSRYIKAIRDGLVLAMPYTMVASILSLLCNISFINNLLGDTIVGNIQAFVAPASTMTNSVIALFVVIGVAYSLSKDYGMNQIHSAMVSVVMFLINCPSSVIGENSIEIANAISMSYLGPQAIFSALVTAIVGVEVYRWAVTHKLTFNLPSTVPQSIQDSFTSFIPAGIAMLFALVVRALFLLTPQGNMTDLIFYWIQRPLTSVAVSYPGLLVYGVGINLCWFLGLHGQTVVGSVFDAILAGPTFENIDAMAAGAELPNMFTWGYTNPFIALGFWISVPLLIALFLYTKKHKRSDWKEMAKISLIPGLFNIYEPMMFGMPLVLNPFALIPMILTPVISHTVGYLLTVTHIIPYGAVWGPMTTPVFVSGIISTGSVIAGLVQLLLMIPLAAMWYFFLMLQDKSERELGIYVEEENEGE